MVYYNKNHCIMKGRINTSIMNVSVVGNFIKVKKILAANINIWGGGGGKSTSSS